ncbi:MAG TPA: DUF1345 domain-containing protein [Ramlibacter sp.]|nr:DUF1345 domain-containing protein [Ramlibacter sp.]
MANLIGPLKHEGLHRPRLLGAAIGGLLVWLVLPPQWTPVTRALVAWNVAVWPYIASIGWLMLRATPARVRTIAEQENASSATLVAVMSSAAVLSLVAIVAELSRAGGSGHSLFFGFALPLLTVSGSWFLVGVIYTFHYAHMYYEVRSDTARPLRFPEGLDAPTYLDFLYFSFTISAAAQTSDVTVMSSSMRGAVVAQSVLSFFFNVAILGLSINIAAGVVGAAR